MAPGALPLSPEVAMSFHHLRGFSAVSCGGSHGTECNLVLTCLAIPFVLGCQVSFCTTAVSLGAETFLIVFFDQPEPAISLSAVSFSLFESPGFASLRGALSGKRAGNASCWGRKRAYEQ